MSQEAHIAVFADREFRAARSIVKTPVVARADEHAGNRVQKKLLRCVRRVSRDTPHSKHAI
jgi:hypothetical protein